MGNEQPNDHADQSESRVRTYAEAGTDPDRAAVHGLDTAKLIPDRIVLTVREAGELLGKSETTIRRWMTAGEIDYVQMGENAQMLIPKTLFLKKFGL